MRKYIDIEVEVLVTFPTVEAGPFRIDVGYQPGSFIIEPCDLFEAVENVVDGDDGVEPEDVALSLVMWLGASTAVSAVVSVDDGGIVYRAYKEFD